VVRNNLRQAEAGRCRLDEEPGSRVGVSERGIVVPTNTPSALIETAIDFAV
jgi:hypothetical protein